MWLGSLLLVFAGISVIAYSLLLAFEIPLKYTIPILFILALYASKEEGSVDWDILKYPFHRFSGRDS